MAPGQQCIFVSEGNTGDCLESSELQYPQMRFLVHLLVQGITAQPFSHSMLFQIHVGLMMMVQSRCHLLSSFAMSWPSSTDCIWSMGCVQLQELPLQLWIWVQALADKLIRNVFSHSKSTHWSCSLDGFRGGAVFKTRLQWKEIQDLKKIIF